MEMIAENEYFFSEIDGVEYRGQLVTHTKNVFGRTTVYFNIWKNYKKTFFGLFSECDWSNQIYAGEMFADDFRGNNIEYLDGIFWFNPILVKPLFQRAIYSYNSHLEYQQKQEYKKSNIKHIKNI